MAIAGTAVFTDSDTFRASFRGAEIDLVFNRRVDFRARLTWVELANLHLLSVVEDLSRLAYVALLPKRIFVSIPMHFDPPPKFGGVELQSGDVVFHSRGEQVHHQTNGPSHWILMSLVPGYLAKHGKILTGLDLVPPQAAGRVLRSTAIAATNLRRLNAKACRLAESTPAIIRHKEAARALEQELFHALVNCLTAGEIIAQTVTTRHRTSIMLRFEEVLAANPTVQLSLPELTAAIGVAERTLRICCAEVLGMGPSQYVRSRRLNSVRGELQRADPTTATIAEVARRYGFAEPGRFAVLYRSAFGETPSATMRRPHSRVMER